ncbi:hypothetical protein D9619_004555 [Psilocybe cf. subviscida]|uniref:Uncharacterized protein n=1 Tax=Psilocybe cf. subviscida TaxID=2480587 RepID=A0A8H5BR87_9AGAR|nr:hypothetical protein D9619_004555 [Psilocybe cf. subviscida]
MSSLKCLRPARKPALARQTELSGGRRTHYLLCDWLRPQEVNLMVAFSTLAASKAASDNAQGSSSKLPSSEYITILARRIPSDRLLEAEGLEKCSSSWPQEEHTNPGTSHYMEEANNSRMDDDKVHRVKELARELIKDLRDGYLGMKLPATWTDPGTAEAKYFDLNCTLSSPHLISQSSKKRAVHKELATQRTTRSAVSTPEPAGPIPEARAKSTSLYVPWFPSGVTDWSFRKAVFGKPTPPAPEIYYIEYRKTNPALTNTDFEKVWRKLPVPTRQIFMDRSKTLKEDATAQ